MDWSESVGMAVRTLSANRLRSVLTVLGIIIGNGAVIAMVGVGEGARRYATDQLQSLGTNLLFVVPGQENARRRGVEAPNTLTFEDAEAILRQVPTVDQVAPQITDSQLASYRARTTRTTLIGTTASYAPVQNFAVAAGRFFTDLDVERNSRVAVLGADLAEKLFGTKSPLGERVRFGSVSFQVIGVMEAKGAFLGSNRDDAAFIPISTMSNLIAGRRSPYGLSVGFISVSARDEESIEAAAFQITNLLRRRHKITLDDDFYIRTQKDAVAIASNVASALTIVLAATAAISLLVGGIGIMNIMLVSVTERTQEIGLRKAIGADPADILTQFLIEAVILAVVGGLLGTALGGATVILIGIYTPLETVVSLGSVLLAVSVSGGIGLIFGVVPARRAAALDPIVALRSA
ncbi:MAG: ABC transporter permease [Gloeomargaritaceae cyanobacterium C42_A2020_066]|nr:ABC transporter permease [Gloeomargaritaceae cyanobacterium C42_A2020_066]